MNCVFGKPLFYYTNEKNQILSQFLQNINPRDTQLSKRVEDLFSKLYIEELVIYPNRMTKTKEQIQVQSIWGEYRTSPCIAYNLKLPFTGDSNLFNYHGTTFFFDDMDFEIYDRYIVFQIEDRSNSAVQVKKDTDTFIHDLQKHLDSVNEGARQYNASLKQSLEDLVRKRIEELNNKRKEEALAGLPPDEDDVDGDTIVPLVLKPRLEPRLEEPGEFLREPNYVLNLMDFDEIISSIKHTASYMETHIDSFSYMEEEHIRDHILSMLNGMLSIRATGETFNGKGKTDILYPYKEKNIFIAECKVWHGQSEFVKAIDQLEGYLGWNDTKTALIIFYRNKESMSEKIIEMRNHIKSRANFRTTLAETNRGGRFLMDHPQDSKKSYYLELIVFNFG